MFSCDLSNGFFDKVIFHPRTQGIFMNNVNYVSCCPISRGDRFFTDKKNPKSFCRAPWDFDYTKNTNQQIREEI